MTTPIDRQISMAVQAAGVLGCTEQCIRIHPVGTMRPNAVAVDIGKYSGLGTTIEDALTALCDSIKADASAQIAAAHDAKTKVVDALGKL